MCVRLTPLCHRHHHRRHRHCHRLYLLFTQYTALMMAIFTRLDFRTKNIQNVRGYRNRLRFFQWFIPGDFNVTATSTAATVTARWWRVQSNQHHHVDLDLGC